jgi:hypothetical protein
MLKKLAYELLTRLKTNSDDNSALCTLNHSAITKEIQELVAEQIKIELRMIKVVKECAKRQREKN